MKFTANKALTLALTVQLLAGLPLAASAAVYTDTQYNWARDAISNLSDQNILTGYPDNTFRPEGLITRAEFSAMLVKALGLSPTASGMQSFRDVPPGHWAYPAIETVRNTGLVSGYPNGTFMPNRSISRAEAMAILANAARLPMPDANQANQILSGFQDAYAIPNWARPAVAASVQAGIFANEPGATNRIEPQQAATRAEVAAMVQNMRIAMNQAPQTQQTVGQAGQMGMPPGTYAGGATVSQQGGQTVLQGRIIQVPANTEFTGTLTAPISSQLNQQGDTVSLRIDQPLVSQDGQHVIVPAGSQIFGRITEVKPAKIGMTPGKMDIEFYEIVTPNGQHYTIQGQIATEDGMLSGDTTKGRILRSAATVAVTTGLGAALGTAAGPMSGGSVGKGAIAGTILGGGAGVAAVIAQKGKPVEVKTGEQLEIRLEQPIIVEVTPNPTPMP